MNVSELVKADHLHHAYIVKGGTSDEVTAMLEKRGVDIKGNADVLTFRYAEMLVDDARSVASYAFLKSVGESKYFILSFDRANDAAQNALLKVVEEAPGKTVFFFCVQSEGGLLATLRSRCVSVRGSAVVDESDTDDAKEFLELPYPERLVQVDKLVAASQKAQDRTGVRAFVRSLVTEAHAAKLAPNSLRALLNADRYLRLSGSSPKVVLSHLAVALPRTKNK